MAKVITNQIVSIACTDMGGETVKLTMPAYEVDPLALAERVSARLMEYLTMSVAEDCPVSMSDFTLWLIRYCHENEPRVTEVP